MIAFDEAIAIVSRFAVPLGSERVSLNDANGRILSAPVIAQVDSPPAAVSAMDGYAFRDSDLPEACLVGKSFPGQGFAGAVGQGECVRIFTGAPVPEGADRVVVQEMVMLDGDRVIVEGKVSSGRHIRARGSDFARGDELLGVGRRLDPRALVAAAGADVAEVQVTRRPRVTILATGDELAEPGTARHSPGSIPESVSLGVAALVEQWEGLVIGRVRLRDDPVKIEAAAQSASRGSDVIVITGGASVGEKDFAKSVFESLGLELIFSKLAIKPGKPVWFGRIGDMTIIGLPGNPTSALVTARLLLAPLVIGLAGADPRLALQWGLMPLAAELGPCGDRETFVRAVRRGKEVLPLANQDSGAQRTLAEADLLIRRVAGATATKAGESVVVIDF